MINTTPIEEMTNEEIYAEYKQVSKIIRDYDNGVVKLENYEDRNKWVPRCRELSRAYDWGFKVGQKVETSVWQKRRQAAIITEHDAVENKFLIENDKGWEVWVRGISIREIPEDEQDLIMVTSHNESNKPKQLMLF